MSDISVLARLVGAATRGIDISANTLVTLSVKVGGGVSNTELTKTILDRLVSLQNGTDVNTSYHTHDTVYTRTSSLSAATNGTDGSRLIGDYDNYLNFTPTAATVKGALLGIDSALGAILTPLDSVFRIENVSDTTKKIAFSAAGITTGHTRTITMPDADVDLGNLTNSNIAAGAAIAYSKLNLSGSIVNSDVSPSAAIAYTKLATLGGSTNDVLIQSASGYVQASGILSGNLFLADGTVPATGNFNLNSNKITGLANGTNPNDAVNYGQLTSASTGLLWQNPVRDPDITDDSLSAPPGSPIYSLTYVIGASPTGAWSGFAGHVVWWDGANWIDISNGLPLGSGTQTAMQVGDRFGVSIDTPEVFTFTVTAANATAGAIYLDSNGYAFIVQSTIAGGTTLVATSNGYPPASGTITKSSGTGDSTITYSSFTAQLGGSFAGHHNTIATVTNATPGSYAYTFASPANNWAFNVNAPGSQHYGSSYTYVSSTLSWVDFSGPSKILAGNGLSYSGNTLNVNVDGTTIDFSGNNLEVKAGGITNTQVSASAAIAYSKLNLSASIVNADISPSAAIAYSKLSLAGSIVNSDVSPSAAIAYSKLSLSNSIVNADINASAAIAYSKLNLSNSIQSTDLVNNAVTAAKVNTNVFDQLTITGGNGSAAAVQNAPAWVTTEVAGQSFSANTTYAIRRAIVQNGETAGRVYAADIDTSTYDEFYVIGLFNNPTSVSAGNSITVVRKGLLTLGSSDTAFATNDQGKPFFLQAAGAWSNTAPSTTGQAITRLGIVKSTNVVDVDAVPVGVN